MNAKLELLLFFTAFGLLWAGVIISISIIGGWNSLAKTYRATEPLEGIRFGMASLSMGPKYFPANYSSCLIVRVGEHGIGIKVWPMFRLFHPPLLIPWSKVVDCRRETVLFFSFASVFVSGVTTPLKFSGRAGRAIEIAWEYQHAEHERNAERVQT